MIYNNDSNQHHIDPKQWIMHQIPWSTKVRHYLAYYNPIIWWRATVMKKRMIHWNLIQIIILYSVLPLFKTITKSCNGQMVASRQEKNDVRRNDSAVLLSNDSHNTYWISLLFNQVTLIVPMLLQSFIYCTTYRLLHAIHISIYEIKSLRFITHTNAYQCLYNRIQQQRVYRTYLYDIYLPPSKTTTTTNTNTNEYILFLPGAYVEHVAYSEPASLLSDYGYIVIVLSSEPLGIVDRYISPFTPSSIRSIQHTIEQQYNNHNNNTNNNSRWILMGHSMGSLTCTKLISKLYNINDIVMWGSAPFLDYMDDISHYTHPNDNNNNNNNNKTIRVLVVQGTNDDIIQLYSTSHSRQEFWNRLPKVSTLRYDIIGGTHHGFSNYIITKNNHTTCNNNNNNLSTNEQHSIAVKATVDFLKNI